MPTAPPTMRASRISNMRMEDSGSRHCSTWTAPKPSEIVPRPWLRPVYGWRSAPNSSISPAGRTAVAPWMETLRQIRMHNPLSPRSSQKPREASDWRTVSRIMQRTTRMAVGEFMAVFPGGRGVFGCSILAHWIEMTR